MQNNKVKAETAGRINLRTKKPHRYEAGFAIVRFVPLDRLEEVTLTGLHELLEVRQDFLRFRKSISRGRVGH